MRILLGLALLAPLLGGCAGSPLGDTIAGPEKLAADDDAYCNSIGAQTGSPAYTNCRMQMTQRRDASHEGYRNRAMVGAAIASEMNRPAPVRQPTTCTTYGRTTTCN